MVDSFDDRLRDRIDAADPRHRRSSCGAARPRSVAPAGPTHPPSEDRPGRSSRRRHDHRRCGGLRRRHVREPKRPSWPCRPNPTIGPTTSPAPSTPLPTEPPGGSDATPPSSGEHIDRTTPTPTTTIATTTPVDHGLVGSGSVDHRGPGHHRGRRRARHPTTTTSPRSNHDHVVGSVHRRTVHAARSWSPPKEIASPWSSPDRPTATEPTRRTMDPNRSRCRSKGRPDTARSGPRCATGILWTDVDSEGA